MSGAARVSVVITTFERPDACQRALESVLSQERPADEILVCDDGSRDETPQRFRAWEQRDSRIRYLRVEHNHGTPGFTRNLGTLQATGDIVAFLDDDDQWFPGKLARQAEFKAADVIGTNAVRHDGSLYFALAGTALHPSREQIISENPLIMSSVLAPRHEILAAGGFMTSRWARGIADYAMWLALADRGLRVAVLPEPLVLYEGTNSDRMSAKPVQQELALARLMWGRVLARPTDPVLRRAALARSRDWLKLAAGTAVAQTKKRRDGVRGG